MKKKYLIIYHKDDNDGVLSGAMLFNYLTDVRHIAKDDIETYGADYNMLAEFSRTHKPSALHEEYENLILTDISFNDSEYMKKLYKEFGSNMIWCDHHAPIIKESLLKGFDGIPGERLTDRSAILCVYKFLYDPLDEDWTSVQIPEILNVLSAWDSWTYEQRGFERDFVRDVNKGLTFDRNLDFLAMCAVDPMIVFHYKNVSSMSEEEKGEMHNSSIEMIKRFRQIGKMLNEYDDINAENNVRDCGDLEWKVVDEETGDRRACALFIQGASNSQMFKSLIGTEIRHGIVFKHQKNSNWTVSMYNVNDDDDFHCGEFLKKKYGGGGHKGAAGCTLTEKQFIEILQNKCI